MNRPRRPTDGRVAPWGRAASQQPRVIPIHTEGRVTERDYLSHWGRLNSGVRIDWGESGVDPVGLVDRARKEVKRSSANRRRYGTADFDEVWCVFDADTHSKFSQAIHEAAQSGIKVAVSNPCFELWLVLHCEDKQRSDGGGLVQRRARELGLVDGKNVPDAAWRGGFEDGYEDAKRRAQGLDRMHDGNQSPQRSNPSTDVWRLVDRIRTKGATATTAGTGDGNG